jgi:hypothetical protein
MGVKTMNAKSKVTYRLVARELRSTSFPTMSVIPADIVEVTVNEKQVALPKVLLDSLKFHLKARRHVTVYVIED